MVNRGALMLRYSQVAVDWLNKVDPSRSSDLMVESINEERTVYLVSNEVADSPDSIKAWVKLNHEVLFEGELFQWYVDESLWPKKRNWALFQKWFTIECHSVVEDTMMGHPIIDDDA
ncbi:hypothetical protein D8T49_21695 [Vibrio vulnificus]|uniref:hypothetical protein n=1 Tax=Vibrio vulnificus TaxID=672 RepID=UPI0010231C46|nr:hypothetical protein [Vibrio vulnificus]MCU8190335.1 hypothetical protein [Vibrio vulnificus]MCU8199118.1 hypothetical protein [Vibrio vulnificus]MCU8313331.1 hypothetical protein [Vibrio vulnificus]RZP97066.1 hypothetical protein D8T37_21300 [Vibrio vulnificus]RZQ44235.1 hypothetical protein D8T49_21695 [Vibrio vulnificus]